MPTFVTCSTLAPFHRDCMGGIFDARSIGRLSMTKEESALYDRAKRLGYKVQRANGEYSLTAMDGSDVGSGFPASGQRGTAAEDQELAIRSRQEGRADVRGPGWPVNWHGVIHGCGGFGLINSGGMYAGPRRASRRQPLTPRSDAAARADVKAFGPSQG
jgi:hypothetical protein